MEGKDVIEAKPSYMSEVHRALVVLGFSETERSVGVERNCAPQALKTFSSWIDRVQALPTADEQLCATWTEFMRARFGGSEPPMTPTAVNEAAHAARYAITMQIQLFPPRARRDYEDDQSYAAEWTELSAWRKAAKANGIASPAELSESAKIDFGQFVDRKVLRDWQKATGSDTPMLAAMNFDSLRSAAGDTLTRLQLSERNWQLATGCESSKAVESFRAEWRTETNCMFPKEAGDKIRSLRARLKDHSEEWSEVEHWKTETGCATATGAGELIKTLRNKSDATASSMIERAWQESTGCSTTHAAASLISNLDNMRTGLETLRSNVELRESTIRVQSKMIEDLQAQLRERNQDLLTANAEIDRVKNAAQTLGLVSDKSTELAKVRAELQTKQRECQTEKERADRLEAEANRRGVLLTKISEALQANNFPLIWDPLPTQVAYVVDQRQFEKTRANAAEGILKIEQQKHDDTKKELRVANQFANEHSIMWERMSAAIGMKQDAMIDVVEWIEDVQKKLASAIIPQLKPNRVEGGQRWMRIYDIDSVRMNLERPSGQEAISDATGFNPIAMQNGEKWIYAGKQPSSLEQVVRK